ncbi:MAG: PEP-CTERM sorting domain-containing protein [Chthoniobacterales bacterium]
MNLATGQATSLGAIGGNPQLLALAVASVPEPAAWMLLLLAVGVFVARAQCSKRRGF